MIDPNSMTLDALRDWLAERKGWEKYIAGNGITVWHRGDPASGDYYQHASHPIPATRDAAAAALPEAWEWRRIDEGWVGGKLGGANNTFWRMVSTPDTGYEITDRFRLACKCIIAEENK